MSTTPKLSEKAIYGRAPVNNTRRRMDIFAAAEIQLKTKPKPA